MYRERFFTRYLAVKCSIYKRKKIPVPFPFELFFLRHICWPIITVMFLRKFILKCHPLFKNDKSILPSLISFFMCFCNILFVLLESSWIYFMAFLWWMLLDQSNGFQYSIWLLLNKYAYMTKKKYEKSFKFLTENFLAEVDSCRC